MSRLVTSFTSGLLFAVGLAISGMTQPEKILGFLDFTGAWDAALLWVMVGAVSTFMGLRALSRSVSRPLFAEKFHLPSKRDLDGPLLLGSAMFGIGWGLLGYCPGPGLVSVVTLEPPVVLFVAAMLFGMMSYSISARRRVDIL